jgi:hypothetical protein
LNSLIGRGLLRFQALFRQSNLLTLIRSLIVGANLISRLHYF